MPETRLPAPPLRIRSEDVRLSDDLLARFALLAPLQRRPALYRFPGSVALRHFKAGEVLARPGERMATAFYLLTSADEIALLSRRSKAERLSALQLDTLRTRGQQHDASSPVLQLMGAITQSTPCEGLCEGELFGESACLEGTPRPLGAVALRDGYLLEMRADFLAAVLDDPYTRQKAESVYRDRILRLHLSRLPLFHDLSDAEFAFLRDGVEMRTVHSGETLAHEHATCEGVILVRSGIVKLSRYASPLLSASDVIDWNLFRKWLRESERTPQLPRGALWRRLPQAIQTLLRASSADVDPVDRCALLDALNHLILNVNLLDDDIRAPSRGDILSFPGANVDSCENRRLLDRLFLSCLRGIDQRPPELVVNYCARGEAIGIQEVMLDRPNSASAIALGHPNATGRIDLAWLSTEVFRELIADSPRLRNRVAAELAKAEKVPPSTIPGDQPASPAFSTEALELGLPQGQQLMLVDLDRCTRCDDCVHACADVHEDGISRVVLDGPRFERFLVPTSCRSCLDPVCLIGCPVNSIHRAPGGEVRIEDWCIGCGLCSESCPYGSIQMHDLGVVPSVAGWRLYPVDHLKGTAWTRPEFSDKAWLDARPPLLLDRALQDDLEMHSLPVHPLGFALRHRFQHTPSGKARGFRLELQGVLPPRVWLNGTELQRDEKFHSGRHLYTLDAKVLRRGENVLAVRVGIPDPLEVNAVLFQARLDALPTPAPAEPRIPLSERIVTHRAVVCDLCATQAGGPACVTSCAHDAAFRVDGRLGLPVVRQA